jgi:hypothetical protein
VTRPGRVRVLIVGLVGLGGLTLAGCSKSGGQLPDNEAHLKALAILYGRYVSAHRGMGPTDEVDLKKFIQSFPSGDLESLRVDPNDLDKTFTSPRDKQPYGVAYKTRGGSPGGPGGGPMVAWEQTGSGGKRVVADSLGKIEEIDEAEFNKRFAALGTVKK